MRRFFISLTDFSRSDKREAHLNNVQTSRMIAVGADAHIGPAEQAIFTGICGEFVTSQRADVGIGPYANLIDQ